MHGYKNLELTPMEILMPYDFGSGEFRNNQTICMAIFENLDSDDTSINAQPKWLDVCTTTYLDDKISCRCPTIKNWYIGIVNDYTRIYVGTISNEWQIKYIMLFIVVPLILLGFLGPSMAEKRDLLDA